MRQKFFRYDIQGLRAIAVLAVVIFHIDPTKLPGGYLGVDIFFVISGFLITSHIMDSLNAGTFSFRHFYMKRIRRLYPALLATMAVSTIFVCILYLPTDTERFAEALMSTAVYGSNIYFYAKSDYFDASLQSNPLLHTWSLSVEEQFYIFFPIFLFFIHRYLKGKIFWVIALTGVASFILSEIVLRVDPAAAFFLSPTRFGQFIAGGVLVFIARPTSFKMLREAISWLSLFALAGCMFLYSEETAFPGFASILPTLCIAAIIYAGADQSLFASRFLSLKPAQIIGNISYSLYLWHWPIVVFYRYHYGDEILKWEKVYVLIACLIAGWLSYYLIEKPGLKLDLNKPYFMKGTIAVTVITLAIGLSLKYSNGFEQRYDPEVIKVASYLDYEVENRDDSCFLNNALSISDFDEEKCLKAKTDKPSVLLIGDSHAAHLYAGLNAELKNFEIMQATISGCRQLINTEGKHGCMKLREDLFSTILPKYHFDIILISHRWYVNEIKQLNPTIKALSPYADEIVISGSVPEYQIALPKLLAQGRNKENKEEYIRQNMSTKDIEKLDIMLAKAAKEADTKYFSPYKALCGNGNCLTQTDDNIPIQFDYGHLTKTGASLLVEDMKRDNIF